MVVVVVIATSKQSCRAACTPPCGTVVTLLPKVSSTLANVCASTTPSMWRDGLALQWPCSVLRLRMGVMWMEMVAAAAAAAHLLCLCGAISVYDNGRRVSRRASVTATTVMPRVGLVGRAVVVVDDGGDVAGWFGGAGSRRC